MTDYQNKRRLLQQPPAAVTKFGKDGAIHIKPEPEEDEEEDDGWGDDWGAAAATKVAEADLKNFDYDNTNLNKLSDVQIAMHKKKMDEKFLKN